MDSLVCSSSVFRWITMNRDAPRASRSISTVNQGPMRMGSGLFDPNSDYLGRTNTLKRLEE